MAAAVVTLAVAGVLLVVVGGATSSSTSTAGGVQRLGDIRDGALIGDDVAAVFKQNDCRRRVVRASRGMRHSGDVVVIPEFRAVYLVMVKSASESIRTKLDEDFDANWKQPIPGAEPDDRPPGSRQRSHMLTPDIIQNYPFFTFVRDPATRFRSSYKQAMCREDAAGVSPPKCRLCRKAELAVQNPADVQHSYRAAKDANIYTPTVEEFAGALLSRRTWTARRISKGRVFTDMNLRSWRDTEDRWVDEHAQAQMFRITAVGPDRVTPVPMHFIGRVENFEADWAKLMDKLGVDASDERRRAAPGHEEAACDRAATRGAILEAESATPVQEMERQALTHVYMDDFVCFGYSTSSLGLPAPTSA